MSSDDGKIWLFVGLGNPGERFEGTRHNLGFMAIDRIAEQTGSRVRREECGALVGRAVFENTSVELVKPQTFMNLSGETVRCLLRKEERSSSRMIVFVDDLALPLGSIRLRRSGSHGGHNGLRSIEECTGSKEYIRLRMGIGPDHEVNDASRFVLERFPRSALETVEKMVESACDAARVVVAEGIESAMGRFNTKIG